ncbi:Retrovirus-related Pol polyprotein from transposon TNT 1-94 [Vitis vinifera]|uniref:Retrovirus-related Pol polyprotein from transposon TNT 1-94 n=1 Tax=Vitis vinifera TaxID=29760 RepID=A0A438GUZ9_VITVI|nr:Retrovirus-related Pol polyprotein from transposon TNT 1-94 [Vitis vinifera]
MNSASSISANVNNIPVLNGTNFKKWKRARYNCARVHGFRLCIKEDRPSDLTSASTAEQRSTMEKWERSNRMSLMIMKHSIPEAIRGAIPEETQAKAFLDQIANRFAAKRKGREIEARKDRKCSLGFHIQGFGTNKKRKRDNKGKQTAVSGTSKQKEQKKQDKEITCFFCKKAGHMKKTCTKYAAWREKKGTLLNFGCLRSRMPTDGERYIYVGNGNKAAVKAIGLFRLQLDSGCSLTDKLYKLNIKVTNGNETLHSSNYGIKRKLMNENSSMLWHKRLGHISNQRIQRLVSEGILDPLDFSDFQVCIECIKGKQNKYEEKNANRAIRQIFDGVWVSFLSTPCQGIQAKMVVAERRNRTLKDMKYPSKAVAKTPYELWTSKKPSIRHLHVWGCPAEASLTSQMKRNWTPEQSFFETGNAKFIEDVELSGREPLRKVVFEEEFVNIPIIATGHGHIMFNDTIQNVQSITGIQDTPEIPPAQVMEPIQVHQEVTQQPQEPQVQVPLGDPLEKGEVQFQMIMLYISKNMSLTWVWKTIQFHYIKWTLKTAFLNGNIDETIYMVQPENFESKDSKQLVCRLKVGANSLSSVLYVDDILLASSDVGLLHETKRFLSSKFDMKDLGNASFVLGIQIHRDRSRGILGLSQKAYIDKVLSRFGNEQLCTRRYALGSLMYAQVCTRPDIAYIVGMLGRYLSNPGMDHWKKAKRVMRYLQRTKDYMLTYRRSSHLEIVGYSDSDFAGCLDSRRSTSGYIFMLAGGAVSWKSVKQTLVASSTMEAEFIACYEASNHGIWLQNFVTQLRIVDGIEKPLRINC